MPRKKFIEDKLQEIGAEVGDRLQVTKKGDKKEGILMPHHEFSDDDIINIKLDNGYNIGLAVDITPYLYLGSDETIAFSR